MKRSGEVFDGDVGADRIMVVAEQRLNGVAAGHLQLPDQVRGGEHAGLFDAQKVNGEFWHGMAGLATSYRRSPGLYDYVPWMMLPGA
ncbi:MAG: hypothetical protein R2762_25935 [Bryobacteraceae bacterium]